MTKKRTKKTSSTKKTKKRTSSTTKKITVTDREIEHAILQNLVQIQKVHTDLAEKFDHLTKELSQLLTLFEVTARNFAKNVPANSDYQKDKDFLEKIDRLLDQNKLLARGMTMMEEKLRERMYGPQPSPSKEKKPEGDAFKPSMASRRTLPRF
ncbi:MAG: hypothetical protein ABIH92_04425 [Nanoarchaeota archaeon]